MLNDIKFKKEFWILNLIQMLERLAYASVILQMAVYIAQKDIPGGLHWEHSTKGWIFFIWAIIQNLTPVILGGLSDRLGRKKILSFAIIISSIGFLCLGFFRDLIGFTLATIVLGFGLGLFKPTLQAYISQYMNNDEKSIGWSINIMLINLSVFFAPLFSNIMHSISWFWVFFGSGILILVNLILLFLIKEINVSIEKENTNNLFKDLFLELKNPKILLFLLIMVGFTTLYMQFYETLPNYIYDWINSNHLIEKLNLPEFLLSTNNFGKIIDFKWLYNINSGLIIIFIVPISFLLKKRKFSLAIIIGLSLVTIGLFLSGGFNLIEITFIGMGIYTFGEMIINPKIIEFMSKIGNENKRALYLGLINISFGLGLAIGSLLGGYIYKHFGEKSSLAQKYLYTYFPNELNINHSNALNRLMELKNIDFIEATELLYNYYHPNLIWIPFLIIGLISIVFFYLYKKRYNI